jgi:hypothetical protein
MNPGVRMCASPGPDAVIGPDLLRSYCETDYIIKQKPPLIMRIGSRNLVFRQLSEQLGFTSCVFVTACNPFSQLLDPAANAIRYGHLFSLIMRLGIVFLEGEARHPSNGWPPEAGAWLWGLDIDAACAIGRRWQQNAVVWIGGDHVPQLLLLR